MRKAKIICTMGPASREEPVLGRLVEAGMDVARLNFSHGTHDDHLRALTAVRRAAERAGRPVGVLLDLHGPKIRVGKIEGGKVKLEEGAETTVVATDHSMMGNAQRFACSYEKLADDVSIGDPVLINDGAIRLEVLEINGKEVRCRVAIGGMLSDHKGINLPGTAVSIPALTEKDIVDLKFGLIHEVDFIALSFVRSADDIRLIKRYAPLTPIIAKLEKPQAVDRIDEIAQLAEGVMIARGDLGVEMPLERVPLIQKTGIERTNYHGKIAIVATQMLESMIVSPQPTRAEVSDVANAVLDGADAVMLSAETATGAYPVETVEAMAQICAEAEKSDTVQLDRDFLNRTFTRVDQSIAMATLFTAFHLKVKAIASLTDTGSTALWMSRHNCGCPIYALTPKIETQRKMALYRNVSPLFLEQSTDRDGVLLAAEDLLVARGQVKNGDVIVLTIGEPMGKSGGTNTMKIVKVGEHRS